MLAVEHMHPDEYGGEALIVRAALLAKRRLDRYALPAIVPFGTPDAPRLMAEDEFYMLSGCEDEAPRCRIFFTDDARTLARVKKSLASEMSRDGFAWPYQPLGMVAVNRTNQVIGALIFERSIEASADMEEENLHYRLSLHGAFVARRWRGKRVGSLLVAAVGLITDRDIQHIAAVHRKARKKPLLNFYVTGDSHSPGGTALFRQAYSDMTATCEFHGIDAEVDMDWSE